MEEIKQILEEVRALLLDEETVISLLETKLEDNNKSLFNEKSIKELADYHREKFLKDSLEHDEKDLQYLKERATEDYWKNHYKNFSIYCENKLKKAEKNPITENPDYVKLINLITYNGDIHSEEETAKEIAPAYVAELEELLMTFYGFYDHYLTDCKGISQIDALKVQILQNQDKGALKENAVYSLALKEIGDNIQFVIDTIKATVKKTEDTADPGQPEEYIIAPSRLSYFIDTFTIADTKMLNILTTERFNPDMAIFSKSEDTLNSLHDQDREILEYITLTLYNEDITVFSDYQIATGLYKDKATDTVSDSMLKSINESIDRIRNIKIDEGFITAKKIDDINAKVSVNDNLVNLRKISYEHETKATYYMFIGQPFYYDYAVKTGKIQRYKKRIITRSIKDEHIEHNIKNDTLKMTLARRILSLEYYPSAIINVLEIYDILGIKDPRKYTEARKKTKALLKDLHQNFNFKSSFRRNSKGIVTRLVIERDKNNPLVIAETDPEDSEIIEVLEETRKKKTS